jgi:hypothetical protein
VFFFFLNVFTYTTEVANLATSRDFSPFVMKYDT